MCVFVIKSKSIEIYVDRPTDKWMDGCVNGLMFGWMDRWVMDGWMDGKRIPVHVNRQTDEMNKYMYMYKLYKQIEQQMDGWMGA